MVFSKAQRNFVVLLSLFSSITLGKDFNFHFSQNDYNVTLERAHMESYNKQYMKIASLVSFKYNRTDIAVNLTLQFDIDVGTKLEAVLQTYKFASNEYRLFPLRLGYTFCKAFEADSSGIRGIVKCGNICQCSFSKGVVYHTCNYKPDGSKLPPGVPTGRYMAQVQATYESIYLFTLNVYFEITRPEVRFY